MIILNSWVSRVLGAIFLTPPDIIEPFLPMIAPLPTSLGEIEHRRQVDLILDTPGSWWNRIDGYGMQLIDEAEFDESHEREGSTDIVGEGPATYGEITTLGARQLFDLMGMKGTMKAPVAPSDEHKESDSKQAEEEAEDGDKSIVFYDLGSGTGKLIVQSFLELPRLHRGVGIELAPSRHAVATRVWDELLRSGKAIELRRQRQQDVESNDGSIFDGEQKHDINHNSDDHTDSTCTLKFIQGDFFQQNIADATHVYISALCFTKPMMKKIKELLIQASDSSNKLQVVATLREFPVDNEGGDPSWLDQPTSMKNIEMSWTKSLLNGCTCYIYDKQRAEEIAQNRDAAADTSSWFQPQGPMFCFCADCCYKRFGGDFLASYQREQKKQGSVFSDCIAHFSDNDDLP